MDFMGIGPLEVLLVLIVGFLLLGPDKLPGMAAKAGQLYRNFKKATFDLTKTITEDVSSEKKTISEDLSSISKAITEDLSSEKKSITEDLSSISKTITEDLSFENKPENDATTASEAEPDQKLSVENSQKSTPPPETDEDLDE